MAIGRVRWSVTLTMAMALLVLLTPSLVVGASPKDVEHPRIGLHVGHTEVLPDPPTGAEADRLRALHDSPPKFEGAGDIALQVVTFVNWIKVAGDDEWRVAYGTNWQTKANNSLERADDQMFAEFGIDFRVLSYVTTWDTYPDTARVLCGNTRASRHQQPTHPRARAPC